MSEAVLDSTPGDAQAIIDVAKEAARAPEQMDPDAVYGTVIPDGHDFVEINLDHRRLWPQRKRGTVEHDTADSLALFIREQGEPTSRIYADVRARAIVGVINHHGLTADEPQWCDYRARLQLQLTPEWVRWASVDNKLLSQSDFAELIEDGLLQIVTPDGATMLELAKTFEAKTNVAFRQAIVLESGQRQLTYHETVDAKAGAGGSIEIPKEFVLALPPFEGSDAYSITARLRYRINDGRLSLGFQLLRAEDVIRAAFNDAVAHVESLTELSAYRGRPA